MGQDREWIGEVRKRLYVQDISMRELADDIGVTYGYVRAILSGRFTGDRVKKRINDRLGIQEEGGVE